MKFKFKYICKTLDVIFKYCVDELFLNTFFLLLMQILLLQKIASRSVTKRKKKEVKQKENLCFLSKFI